MKPTLGLWAGMGCCLPACVWLAGTLHNGLDARAGLADAAWAAWRLQTLAVLLFTPGLAGRGRGGAAALALMILVPLPLHTVAWLGGAVDGPALARGLGWLLGGAGLAAALSAAAARWLPALRCEPALGLVLLALALSHGGAGP